MKIPMFYSRFSRALKGGLFAFACAVFLMFGAQTGFAISCVGDPTLVLGVDFNTNDDLVLDTGGTCTITVDEDETVGTATIALNSLTIDSGVTLTHAASPTTSGHHNELDFDVSGTVLINGTINVDGKGYASERIEGNASGSYYTGGSHGGRGGLYSESYLPQGIYDSISEPTLPGSGGYRSAGGGVVRITASGDITINGNISANGVFSTLGAGAGGTVFIESTSTSATSLVIANTVVLSADGGDADSGSGGGGRISLITAGTYTNNNTGDDTNVTAYGGAGNAAREDGAAGTVYIEEGGASGDLYVNANDLPYMYFGTDIDADSGETFANVYLKNKARLFLSSDATTFSTTLLHIPTDTIFEADVDMTWPSIDTTTLFLDGGIAKFDGDLTLGTFDTDGDDAETGTLITNSNTYISSGDVDLGSGFVWEANTAHTVLDGAYTSGSTIYITGASAEKGTAGFPDNGTIKLDIEGDDDIVCTGRTTTSFTGCTGAEAHDDNALVKSNIFIGEGVGDELDTLNVTDGATLTTSETTNSTFYGLELSLGTLTLETGGSINVDDKGYMGSAHYTYYYDSGIYVGSRNDSSNGDTENFENGGYQGAGGSHGGRGGIGSESYLTPAIYDSISSPIHPGGGGGRLSGSGAGGGVIRINATTIDLDDDLTANGENSITSDGGGAGGSIYLNASTILLKSGDSIAANGGASLEGAGGGGRIALIYPASGFTNSNGSDDANVAAYGGTGDWDYEDGAAGTVYIEEGGASGDLYINANNISNMYFATDIDSDSGETFANVYLKNKARLFLSSDATTFATTLLHIPTDTVFEADVDMTWASIDTATLFLDGGIAKFDGDLTLGTFDTDDDDAETGTLITNSNTYITSGDVDLGDGFTWEANTAYTVLDGAYTTGTIIDIIGYYAEKGTAGFPDNGTINLDIEGDDDIACTGRTTTSFTGCTGAEAHDDNALVKSIISIGTSPGNDLNTLNVTSGATLTTSETTNSTFYGLELTLGTLTLESGGSINVDGKGYMGSARYHYYYDGGLYVASRNDSSNGDTENFENGGYVGTGGSHGGRGGIYSVSYLTAASYDSISSPSHPGGGGGRYADAGNGGGVIKINATTIDLDDDITANGADSGDGSVTSDGGGAGGSIYLNATSLLLKSGDSIEANGGASLEGSGGGGRIALLYGGFTNSNGSGNSNITAYGGYSGGSNEDGAAGTVFLHDTSASYGDLYIENCFNCSTPYYNTSLSVTVPLADQHVGSNNGYVFNSLITSQKGVINIPLGLDANGTGASDAGRKFFCNNCTPADDNDFLNGEVVYNAELFSGGLSANYVCVSTNADPVATGFAVAKRSDGSGYFDVTVSFNDADTGDTLTGKVEYKSGTCIAPAAFTIATLSDANETSTEAGMYVDSSAGDYWIKDVFVTGGANELTFDWDSATDVPSGDDTYCLQVTTNDGTTDGTPIVLQFTLDNADPSGLTALTVDGRTTLSVLLGWSEVAETNFDHYEVWYGLSQSDVQGKTGTAAEWDDGDDADLGTITTTDTAITGLTPNIGNYFKIWGVDTFGNEETVTDIQAYTDANTPGAPTVAASASDALNVVIDENSNPSSTEYAIKVGALYIQADGTLGAGEIWQTYTTWGGAVGIDSIGLSTNTSYDVSVKARNGDNDETAFSGTTSEYTLAGPVTDVSLVSSGSGMNLYWTDAGQAGLEIYLAKADGSVCDSTYDILEYDNSSVNITSPRSMGAGSDHCHRVRIGSYNDSGVLNTFEYAFSGDLVTSSTGGGGGTSGGSSGGSSTAFYSLLSNVSRSEKIAIDTTEKDELEKAAEEEEIKEEQEEEISEEEEKEEEKEEEISDEEELKKPIFEFDEKYVKEPVFKPVELISDKDDFEIYERKIPEFKLVSELELKYKMLEPIELELSIKEYLDDEQTKKELLKDVVEEFAEEFIEEDFAEEFLEELKKEEAEKAEDMDPEKGEKELDLVEATDEMLEEITGDDTEAQEEVVEPEVEVEEIVPEEKTELEMEIEFEEKAAEILEELTVEEIVTSGVSEVVEASITNSVRAAIEVQDEIEVHTDEGVYVVEDVEEIEKIIAKIDEKEFEKTDLDGDGNSDAWQMAHGYGLFNSDPDGDGIPTNVEVYCGWDALSTDSLNDNLAKTKASNLKGNTFGDVPAIRACGEEGSQVDVVLFDLGEVFGDDKFESEEELTDKLVVGMRNADQQYAGSMVMDESNQGILLPHEELEDGKYIVMLTGDDEVEHISMLNVKNDKVPKPAIMKIGSKGLKLGFVTGNTLYLAEVSMDEFDTDSFVGSFPGAAVPVISGQIEDFESLTVVATWKSRTLSSTAFTDAGDGSFQLEIPNNLPDGTHDIIVYLQNEDEELVSSATVLRFVK